MPKRTLTLKLADGAVEILDELAHDWSTQPPNRSEVVRALMRAALSNPAAKDAARDNYLARTEGL